MTDTDQVSGIDEPKDGLKAAPAASAASGKPAAPPEGKTSDAGRSWLASAGAFALELIEVVVISLAIILPIRYFLIQPFYVKGASMEPTFNDREYLIIDEVSYRLHPPERGDVVVFRYPLDPRQYFIKRIIGLPDEKIRISGNKITVFNARHPEGFPLDESGYLSPSVETYGDQTYSIGDGEYFVMGDNRTSSLDSRAFGLLPAKNIVGRVWVRGWPVSRATVFDKVNYPAGQPAADLPKT